MLLRCRYPLLKVERSQQTPALRIRSREQTQEEGMAFLHRENTDLMAENSELKARLAQISLRLAESDGGMEPSYRKGIIALSERVDVTIKKEINERGKVDL